MRTVDLLAVVLAAILAAILAAGHAGAQSDPPAETASTDRPNIVVVFCDDLGWGDLGSQGHPTIRTPHLDRMAREGQRWTQFYTAAAVCTPSRAALLTGRLPIRTGMCSDTRRVMFPDSQSGLPADEITIAEMLGGAGYATACIGKWHLGHLPPHRPHRHGFDDWFGLPYSNDMDRTADSPRGRAAFLDPRSEYWNVPLMHNDEVVERPADQTTLTQRYTDAAIEFITEHRSRPFFVYLAHSMVHVPLFRSPEFAGRSARGLYGDTVEEIDAGVGRILATLEKLELHTRTLVVFTSDNGPWLPYGVQGGSAGLLRGGKGSTWDGGMRVPALFWWPGRVAPGVVQSLGSTLDLLPTAAALARAQATEDGPQLDGADLSPVLFGEGPGPRHEVPFFRGTRLFALRRGPFKAHFVTQAGYGSKAEAHDPPLLYHMEHDPSERHDVAAAHPDVIAEMLARAAEYRAIPRPPSELEK